MVKQHGKPPPSRLGKGPTPGSFKPGVSGNPAGRPRGNQAFAEKVRERLDPDLVIDLAMRVAEDEKLEPRERLTALLPLIDRGFTKPLSVEMRVMTGTDDLSHATDEQLRAALALVDAGPTDPQALGLDEDSQEVTDRSPSAQRRTGPAGSRARCGSLSST